MYVRFKIRRRGDSRLQLASVRSFVSSTGSLIIGDAEVARQPAEVNVKARCCKFKISLNLAIICEIMGRSVLG